jgi:hypothetical protein
VAAVETLDAAKARKVPSAPSPNMAHHPLGTMRRVGARRRIDHVRVVLTAVLAGALMLAAAACGGSSSSSSSSTSSSTSTSTTTTASTTTATGGGGTGGKLSAAEWATLQADVAQARTVNQQGIKTFKKCRVEVSGNYSNQAIAACFGTSTTSVVAAGQKLNADLATAQKAAGGACAAALGRTQGQVTLYLASVNALGLTVKRGQIPTTDSIDSTTAQLADAQAAGKTVAAACAPA